MGVQTMLARPVYRATWVSVRPTMAPEYRKVVDNLISDLPIVAPRDQVAEYKKNLAQVTAQAPSRSAGAGPKAE